MEAGKGKELAFSSFWIKRGYRGERGGNWCTEKIRFARSEQKEREKCAGQQQTTSVHERSGGKREEEGA